MQSLRGDFSFPRVEKKVSNGGNLFFQGWKVFGKLRELLDG